MKFTDIPQFTKEVYSVHLPLRMLENWIIEQEDELNLQLNPNFQRGHVWTEEQQIKYLEFILRGGTSAREVYFNHPGWLKHFDGEFVCVDGLQRITACRKFLNNKIKVFGYYYKDFEDKISTSICLIIKINNLQSKKEVLQWYLDFNSGGTVHSKEELDRIEKLLKKEMEIR